MAQKRRWQQRAWLHPEPARPDLTDPYGAWIVAHPWDWWATFTFAVEIHPDLAQQRYRVWAEELAEETGLKMQHARALEWQRRGVLHFHALIWGVKRSTRRRAWSARWEEIGGGWAQLRLYDRVKAAAFYLGKYAVKGGEIDHLTFGGPLVRPDDVRITKAGGALPAGRSGPR